MKEFDLEKAKAGAKVCTRDGRQVHISRFDGGNHVYPIVASIEGQEAPCYFTNEGRRRPWCISDSDLMMVDVKHEGWVNLYYTLSAADRLTCDGVYETEKQAKNAVYAIFKYYKTIHVEWED